MTVFTKPATKKVLTEAARLIVDAAEFDKSFKGNDTSFISGLLTGHPERESGVMSLILREADHHPFQEFESIATELMIERTPPFSDMALYRVGDQDLGDDLRDGELATDWREWHREGGRALAGLCAVLQTTDCDPKRKGGRWQ
jgi:hypothetical protein